MSFPGDPPGMSFPGGDVEMPATMSELWNRAIMRRQLNIALPPPPLPSDGPVEEGGLMDLHAEVAALLTEDGDEALSELLGDMSGTCARACSPSSGFPDTPAPSPLGHRRECWCNDLRHPARRVAQDFRRPLWPRFGGGRRATAGPGDRIAN